MSTKNKLTKTDMHNWSKNLLQFSAPIVLAGLLSWQATNDFSLAKGAALGALVGATIDLFKKYNGGI